MLGGITNLIPTVVNTLGGVGSGAASGAVSGDAVIEPASGNAADAVGEGFLDFGGVISGTGSDAGGGAVGGIGGLLDLGGVLGVVTGGLGLGGGAGGGGGGGAAVGGDGLIGGLTGGLGGLLGGSGGGPLDALTGLLGSGGIGSLLGGLSGVGGGAAGGVGDVGGLFNVIGNILGPVTSVLNKLLSIASNIISGIDKIIKLAAFTDSTLKTAVNAANDVIVPAVKFIFDNLNTITSNISAIVNESYADKNSSVYAAVNQLSAILAPVVNTFNKYYANNSACFELSRIPILSFGDPMEKCIADSNQLLNVTSYAEYALAKIEQIGQLGKDVKCAFIECIVPAIITPSDLTTRSNAITCVKTVSILW